MGYMKNMSSLVQCLAAEIAGLLQENQARLKINPSSKPTYNRILLTPISYPSILVQHYNSGCHAQSLAATNRVTEQLNWLPVESFFMSCSISWMASLIDNLYLLDLIFLVIN